MASLALLAYGTAWAADEASPSPKVDVSQTVSQQKTVKGTVIDDQGEPVIGATVKVKNSSVVTLTDIDGHFTIQAPVGSTIEITYIGSVSQSIKVTDATENVNVTMVADTNSLDEVIVVGYGTQKKVNLSGSVASVGSKNIANRPVMSLGQALIGAAPGVRVTQSSGNPESRRYRYPGARSGLVQQQQPSYPCRRCSGRHGSS